jgi:uncharacterized damage-inducible protein DinB
MTRIDPPVSGDERAMLLGFVDFLRETIALKTDDLDAAGLNTGHPPSTMTLGGMLKHLTFVEDYWFGYLLLGNDPVPPWDTAPLAEDPDWEWHTAPDDAPADLRAWWRSAIQRADAVIAGADLDQLSTRARGGEHYSLRHMLIHLIEEYARHCGHADLIRESIDGTVGE